MRGGLTLVARVNALAETAEKLSGETASIRDSTVDGRGVADTDGKCVFVDGALAGETVRYQRYRRRRNYDEARLLEVLEAAPARIEPGCRYFGTCGGCSLQHLDAAEQVRLKERSLFDALERIGHVDPAQRLAPLTGRSWGYRRRARLGAKLVEKKGRVLVGFREKGKPYVADMSSCETLHPQLSALIPPLSTLIESLSIVRQVPQIEMSRAEASTSLVLRVLQPPSAADLGSLRAFQAEYRAEIYLQSGGPETVERLVPESDAEPLFYEIPQFSIRIEFGPLDFMQVNQDINRRMIDQAIALLQPSPEERVLDLFCGLGNFSLPLARRAGSVIGVEIAPAMVEKARANAALNRIETARFIAADLKAAEADWPWLGGHDCLLLDPPRSGARELIARLPDVPPSRILYVSCHPGSLARDAGDLVHAHGYRLVAAGIVDMFPQTSHVESMALFERSPV